MEALALAIVVGLFASLLAALGVGAAVFWIFKNKLIEPKTLFEEPAKKREILVPGEGVFVIKEKRRCKVHTDESEWLKEQDALPRS